MSVRGTAPSSLTEVGERLEEIIKSQEQIFELLERVKRAVQECTNEVAGVHQERIRLVRKVSELDRRVDELEEKGTGT